MTNGFRTFKEMHPTSQQKYKRLKTIWDAWLASPPQSREELARFDEFMASKFSCVIKTARVLRCDLRLGVGFYRPAGNPITPEKFMGIHDPEAGVGSALDGWRAHEIKSPTGKPVEPRFFGVRRNQKPDPIAGVDADAVSAKAKTYPDFERDKRIFDETYANNRAQRWAVKELYPNMGRFF